MGSFEAFPGFGALGFFAGQFGFSKSVLYGFQSNLHFIAHAETALTVGVSKLIQGYHPFRLQACVNRDPLVINIDDHASHDGTGFHVYGLEAFFK